MISENQSKLIRSLRQKKNRDQSRLYLMEGEKMVLELLKNGSQRHLIQQLFATREWIEINEQELASLDYVNEASQTGLNKVSNLKTPQPVLALVTMPNRDYHWDDLLNVPVLAFESIRDPGNFGTIIRTADWFGISNIVCSPDSTDLFNPKVVQATMGAVTRVNVYECPITQLLAAPGMENKPVYGTFLEGESLYEINMGPAPLILFGNESHGLSDRYDSFIKQKISIPAYSQSGEQSESLNIASSVAIVCSELRRLG